MNDTLPELIDIRRNNILTVFDAISRGGRVTRAEISASTGLSQVTVGKSAAVLYENGVIEMFKRPSGRSAGRHTAECFISEKRKLLVFDLSGETVMMSIFGLSLKKLWQESFGYDLAEERCLGGLLEIGEELAGLVCVLPDERQGAASERASDLIARIKKFRKPDAALSAVEASSIYHAEKFDGNLILLKKTNALLSGAVVRNGVLMRLPRGGVSTLYRIEENAARVGAVLSISTGVGAIMLECSADELSSQNGFGDEVSDLFEDTDDIPEAAAASGEPDEIETGAAVFLRRSWLGSFSGAEKR